jgi:hypothetical protein
MNSRETAKMRHIHSLLFILLLSVAACSNKEQGPGETGNPNGAVSSGQKDAADKARATGKPDQDPVTDSAKATETQEY